MMQTVCVAGAFDPNVQHIYIYPSWHDNTRIHRAKTTTLANALHGMQNEAHVKS